MDAPNFDPRTATNYDILGKAGWLIDKRLRDIADTQWADAPSSKLNKGGAGAIIERFFGISPNSEQSPDFVGAGIELKVSPLVMDGANARRIKERTSLTMIDFEALDGETWPTASLRPKLQKILFVFYEWRPDVPLGDLPIKATKLWSPPTNLLPYLERDWMAVWRKNRSGLAHEISEGDGLILGACTKGATGQMKRQPHNEELAKSRAWSLKPKLTWTIYQSTVGQNLDGRLLAELQQADPADPVHALVVRLEPHVGRTIHDIAAAIGVKPSEKAKNRATSIIRKAMGIGPRSLPTDLMALGVEFKTIPLGPNAEPHESMSFPAFDHRELTGEEWEDSDLLSRIQDMVLIPLYREKRKSELLNQRLCRPFHWSPSREELAGIRAEWETYRDRVAAGRADDMPHQAETRFIHVRPHGADGEDRVVAPGGLEVVRKSFWLNQEFVREIVLSSNADWMGF